MKSSISSLIKGKRKSGASVGEWKPVEFVGSTPEEAQELHMLSEGVTERIGWTGHAPEVESPWKTTSPGRASSSEDEEAAAESLRGVVQALIQKKNRHTDSITSVFFKGNEINAENFVWPTLEMLGPQLVEETQADFFTPEVEPEPAVDFEAVHAEAEQILEDARQQSRNATEEILSQARFEAENVLQQARAQSEEIILAAHSHESTVTEQAYQQGLQAANEQAALLLNNVQTIINETQTWREQMLANSETEVVELLKEITQTLFGSGIALSAEMLSQAFAQAVQEAKPLGNLRIRLNPQDMETIGPLWAQQQSSLIGIHIELSASDAILRGGCIIEGDYGTLDGTVDARLKRVVGKIEEAQAIVPDTRPNYQNNSAYAPDGMTAEEPPVESFDDFSPDLTEIDENEADEQPEDGSDEGVIDLSAGYDDGGPTG